MYNPLKLKFMDILDSLWIMAIIAAPLAFTVGVIWIQSKEKLKIKELKAELYAKALEKGVELPPDVLDPDKKHSTLKAGIILPFIGVGLSVFMYLAAEPPNQWKTTALGLFPILLGFGLITVHFVWKKLGYKDTDD
jgi:hypothetical protein